MSPKRTTRWQNRCRVTNYTLRRIAPDLWRRVKSKAAYEGRTVRFVILELLRVYAEHGFEVVESFNGDKEE